MHVLENKCIYTYMYLYIIEHLRKVSAGERP